MTANARAQSTTATSGGAPACRRAIASGPNAGSTTTSTLQSGVAASGSGSDATLADGNLSGRRAGDDVEVNLRAAHLARGDASGEDGDHRALNLDRIEPPVAGPAGAPAPQEHAPHAVRERRGRVANLQIGGAGIGGAEARRQAGPQRRAGAARGEQHQQRRDAFDRRLQRRAVRRLQRGRAEPRALAEQDLVRACPAETRHQGPLNLAIVHHNREHRRAATRATRRLSERANSDGPVGSPSRTSMGTSRFGRKCVAGRTGI